jgi:hypothetical protein
VVLKSFTFEQHVPQDVEQHDCIFTWALNLLLPKDIDDKWYVILWLDEMANDFDDVLHFLPAAWYLWYLIELRYFDEWGYNPFGMGGDAVLTD